MLDDIAKLILGNAQKDQYRGIDPFFAKGNSLAAGADAKILDTLVFKFLGHRDHAVAVGIRFDHRQYGGGLPHQVSHLGKVVAQGRQINFDSATHHVLTFFIFFVRPKLAHFRVIFKRIL